MAKSFLRALRYALIVAVCGVACGCTTVYDWVADFIKGDDNQVDSKVVATWWDGPRIRPGIALSIQVGPVAAEPTVMNVLVDQNGDITLPLLLQEPVACDGLTLEALKQKLYRSYSKYYRQPMITVTFAPYDGRGVSPWGTVTVLGEVSRPGPVNMPATMDLTVTKVLQEAGGLKPFADKTRILVSRCDKDGNQTRTRVNINEIGKDGRIDKDMPLRAGDVVWVPETWY
ncbi:MAG: polysaccharide biosynthesis/export family protein [Kiritimatiellae bacterium]|nr:polysaccharide biosynthesis/export family protein [Kiritimatiellia bacterium]